MRFFLIAEFLDKKMFRFLYQFASERKKKIENCIDKNKSLCYDKTNVC
jgi:hypothetical protein